MKSDKAVMIGKIKWPGSHGNFFHARLDDHGIGHSHQQYDVRITWLKLFKTMPNLKKFRYVSQSNFDCWGWLCSDDSELPQLKHLESMHFHSSDEVLIQLFKKCTTLKEFKCQNISNTETLFGFLANKSHFTELTLTSSEELFSVPV